jgi:hypothetical protein
VAYEVETKHGSYSYSDTTVASATAALTEAAKTDPGIQERLRKYTVAQAQDLALQIINAERDASYKAAKDHRELVRLQSGISAGYRYSFSGADAKAFAYFPSLTNRLRAERNALKAKLDTALAKAQSIDSVGEHGFPNPEAAAAQAEFSTLAGLYSAAPKGWLPLESLSTISINVHEPRSVVRALGHKGIKGYAGSVRTIAGTLIFTVVEHHPLRELMLIDEEIHSSWSIDHYLSGRGTVTKHDDKYAKTATMLSPFNIVVNYMSECDYSRVGGSSQFIPISGYSASVEVEGVQLISQGLVTSVNDVVTELQYQFIANDIKEFAGNTFDSLVNENAVTELSGLSEEQILYEAGISANDYQDHLVKTGDTGYQNIVDTETASYIKERLDKTLGRKEYEGTFTPRPSEVVE